MLLNSLLNIVGWLRGGEWVPGLCGGCGNPARIQYEAFAVESWDRVVISPYRCRRCAKRPPEVEADEFMAPLREPRGRHARRDVTEGRIRLAHAKVRRALEGRRRLP